jgi:hypothetical protein
MIPFTNQFIVNSDIDDDEIYFMISSCSHENIGGIDFIIGLSMAIL